MIIGITTTLNESDGFQRVNLEYINRVVDAGGTPLLLTPINGGAQANRAHAARMIELIDGLLLTGGGDIHPRYYVRHDRKHPHAPLGPIASSPHICQSTGRSVPYCANCASYEVFLEASKANPNEQNQDMLDGRSVTPHTTRQENPFLEGLMALSENRDEFELTLARLAHESDLPTLGICRGMQVLNVALGGSLYRDLYNCGITQKPHRQFPPFSDTSDTALLDAGSQLAHLLGDVDVTMINSMHHQSIDTLADPLQVVAKSADGVIEGVEDPTRTFFIGVQWHPEYLDKHTGLFNALTDPHNQRSQRNQHRAPAQ